ncbi:MAG: 3-deoxy-D-manno-octulosonic acid kinase [Pseudomonadota bacterium]
MDAMQERRQGATTIRYDARLLDPFEPGVFDPAWLAAQGRTTGSSAGRNQAQFFDHGGQPMVLRRFQRGGLIGRVVQNRYVWTGLDRSRAMQELALLHWMRGQGLPVPRPVAAQVTRGTLSYTAALITLRIPGAEPVDSLLQSRPLGTATWARIGAAIRQMHDAGVDHTDLNCRNILVDAEGAPWIIDFDKCRRRPPGPWQQSNLDRLLRSLRKQAAQAGATHWTDADWAALIAAYGADTP